MAAREADHPAFATKRKVGLMSAHTLKIQPRSDLGEAILDFPSANRYEEQWRRVSERMRTELGLLASMNYASVNPSDLIIQVPGTPTRGQWKAVAKLFSEELLNVDVQVTDAEH